MKNIIDFYGGISTSENRNGRMRGTDSVISKCLRYPKDKRKENLIEEMADVSICLEQLRVCFDISEKEIQEWIFKRKKCLKD